MVGSVSSFAYQGTNAHAILVLENQATCAKTQLALWQHHVLWYQVTSHVQLNHFLWQSTLAQPAATFQCALQRPVMSDIMQLVFGDKIILTPTALTELICASGQVLASRLSADSSVMLTAVTFIKFSSTLF